MKCYFNLYFFTFYSALEYCLDVEKLNLSTIRTVRVLRPLRAINRIPSKYKLFKYISNRVISRQIYTSEHNLTRYIFLKIPAGMRILVMLLLDTLPMLGNVLLLCFFVFFIFGIVGVQLWAGLLRQRCYIPDDNINAIVKSSYWK